MKTPTVSIVLPSYNGEKYLRDSIGSVLSQTYLDWELIIVNDCSTDSTPVIAAEYAAKDSRIIVINNEKNKKLPASLNVGFAAARGRYLTWTSDDNLFKPQALEVMVSYLESHPEVDLVSMDYDMIDEEGKVIGSLEKKFPCKRVTAALIDRCNVGAAFMYSKSIAEKVGDYNEELFCAEDYDYWIRVALLGNIAYTEDNIYCYRVHAQQLTSTRPKEASINSRKTKLMYAMEFFKKYRFTKEDIAIWAYKNQYADHHGKASVLLLSKLKLKRVLVKFLTAFIPCRNLRKELRTNWLTPPLYTFDIKK